MIDYQIHLLTWKEKFVDIAEAVRIVYIVRGTAMVVDDENGNYQVSQGDIFVINAGRKCQIEMTPENLTAVLSVNYYHMCEILDEEYLYFFLNSRLDTGGKYTEVIEHMQRILLIYSERRADTYFEEEGRVCLLLDSMLHYFRARDRDWKAGEKDKNTRVLKVLRYIHMNYKKGLSLEEIAKKLYLSPSAASRMFYRATGEHFVSYLNKVRLSHVEHDLLHTDHSILQIALDNGFATPASLNKIFKKEYQMAPTKYREINADEGLGSESGQKISQELYHILKESLSEESTDSTEELWAEDGGGAQTLFNANHLLNVGPIYILRSADVQSHVLEIADQLHIEYIRLWGIFSRQMMIFYGNQEGYNFSFIDIILDFCVENHLKVFFDLGRRKNVALSSERENIYSFEDNMLLESREAWENLIDAFIRHIIYRYGRHEVSQWIFEMTFFLNELPYYSAEKYSSHQVWETTYQIIKKHLPQARIAGPGFPAFCDFEITRMVLRDFMDTQYLPDIFTSFHFPYLERQDMKDVSVYEREISKNTKTDFLSAQILFVLKELKKMDFKGQNCITEWGVSLANRNYIQDSCFRGAFTVFNILKNYRYADALGIFYASDMLNVYADKKAVLQGSGGIVTRHGIPKPVFFALDFLGKLGKQVLRQSENGIITKDEDGNFKILCFNLKVLGSAYYLLEENSYQPEEINRLFVNKDSKKIKITLSVPGDGQQVKIRHSIINDMYGSVLNQWIQLGCASDLQKEDIDYIRKTCVPGMILQNENIQNGKLVLNLTLAPNEVRLITVQIVDTV